jgi:hypothetical protein
MTQYAGELNVLMTGQVDPLIAELRKGGKGLNQFQKEAEKVRKSVQTPMEAHFARAARLREMVGADGGIDRDTYQRALMQSRQLMRQQTEALDENVERRRRITEEQKEQARLQQQATAMWMRHRSLADEQAEELAVANSLRQRGLHTEIQHEQIVRSINDRYAHRIALADAAGQQGQQNANRMNFAVAQLAIAGEDAATVWGTMGFAGAMRAASNNLSQAVMVMTSGTNKMWLASVVGIGAILAGTIVPKVWAYVSGAEEAGKASERWKNRLSEIADMFKSINKMQERRLNHAQEMRGIGDISSSESAKSKSQSVKDRLKELQIEANSSTRQLAANADFALDQFFSEKILDRYEQGFEIVARQSPELAQQWRQQMEEAKKQFLFEFANVDTRTAVENLQNRMMNIHKGMDNQTMLFGVMEDSPLSLMKEMLADESRLNDVNSKTSDLREGQVTAVEKQRMEQEKLKALQEQTNKLLAKEAEERRQMFENARMEKRQGFDSNIEEAKLKLLSEAEQEIYDLQKERVNLMRQAAEFGEAELFAAKELSDELLRQMQDDLLKERMEIVTGRNKTAPQLNNSGIEGPAGAAVSAMLTQSSKVTDAQDETNERLEQVNELLRLINEQLDGKTIKLEQIGGV